MLPPQTELAASIVILTGQCCAFVFLDEYIVICSILKMFSGL